MCIYAKKHNDAIIVKKEENGNITKYSIKVGNQSLKKREEKAIQVSHPGVVSLVLRFSDLFAYVCWMGDGKNIRGLVNTRRKLGK